MSPSVAPVRRSGSIARRNARSRAVVRTRDEERLTADIIELARQYGIAELLRRAGWIINDKRVERIWQREGLKVPQGAAQARQALADQRILHPAAAGAAQSCVVL